MNERNVCIGDVMAVGDELVLQVSLPRQPCFKLNHRFQLKNFAPNTWKTSRTGWYYRVLKEGTVKAGDEIRLIERKHPKWTIERIQEYLHRNKDNLAMNEELAAIQEFGVESKGAFESRVAKAKSKKDKKPKEEQKWRDFKLVEKRKQTPRIMTLVLEAVDKVEEDESVLGAHAKIKLGNGLVRAYSIVGGNQNRLEFGIALDDKSRGGSKYLHETVKVDDILQVGRITNAVDVVGAASNHLFIVGGIGITAFLGIMEALQGINYSVELHYAVRSEDERPYKERLDKLGDSVRLYDKQKGQRMDVGNVIKNMTWNSAIYVCGPKSLMDTALREVKAAGIDEKEVHFEAFEADISGDPFEAVVANRNVTVKVGEEETLLEVLQKQFDDIPSSCEVGNCGTSLGMDAYWPVYKCNPKP
ncbi:putative mosc domain-containing protein [Phaeoacremonium minimum UCRPA7]|uniref:Putative mosc domain-containing protein n=1 Tax=Phaeoacremonium minimum (strain UCR-PA7) TaxID=1286976 RepID=R8BTJ0_PHAM7|nr:putative mosc domain-containing protein [Phaeoacremonium minimum UCRPA7]EOO02671.1 putative mosc domain-containing protein [Phaeoacremonium minimum UCRPA7]